MRLMLVELLVIGYLPGAVLFRLPVADRPARAALPAEERVFWATILSVAISCTVVLSLAAAGRYTFPRLLGVNAGLCVALVALARGNLRLGSTARGPQMSALVPLALVGTGLWLYFPPAEYIIGGRDPGVYINQGVQIAQRGSLLIPDPLVAAVPERMRDLFFPVARDGYRSRFMGFSILNAERGEIVGQFPQLYPISLAVGYGINGLTGVLYTTGVWGMLGVLAVYFAGTWLLGHPAATAAAALLSLCLAHVWFSRNPSSELPLQALLFAGLLAFARMEHDGLRWFAPIAASLFGILFFLRVEAWLVLACVGMALALNAAVGRRTRAAFFVPLLAWTLAGLAYALTIPRPYYAGVYGAIANLTARDWGLFVAALGVGSGILSLARRHKATWSTRLPFALVAGVLGASVYAYFFREPGGALAAHDAYALRTLTSHYLTPFVLAAALAGYAMAVPRVFWKSPLMVLLMTGFCVVFFYKIRIVPEHFWFARRFLPVILPAMLLCAGAAMFSTPWLNDDRWRPALRRVRTAVAFLLVGVTGAQFFQQTRAILPHVEYEGVIPRIEKLATRFGDDDLILVESRGVSDVHVLGLPLAYVYAKHVLVFASPAPDKAVFADFLAWAGQHYRTVFFMSGGGTDLVGPNVDAESVWSERFSAPEYERSWDRAPGGVRHKPFDFGVYRFVPTRPLEDRFLLEVGGADDLYVRRFSPKERTGTVPFRWSGARSDISVRIPVARPTQLTLWVSNGGRPATEPAARLSVYVDDQLMGTVPVDVDEFRPYTFSLPPADRRAGFISVVRIETPTWSPRRALGVADDRELGVMIQRVELR